jgi:hypothetical protein
MTTHEASSATHKHFHQRSLALMFAKPPEMTEDEINIRAWLKANRKTLEGRSAIEIAHLAIFTEVAPTEAIYLVLSDFRSVMGGTWSERRALNELHLLDMAMYRANKMLEPVEADLMPLWEDLTVQFENETIKLEEI